MTKRRFFTRTQKRALYFLSGGKCEECGQKLGRDFHADHKIPYSKGGTTTVDNGQALCPACNLRKADFENGHQNSLSSE